MNADPIGINLSKQGGHRLILALPRLGKRVFSEHRRTAAYSPERYRDCARRRLADPNEGPTS